MSASINSTTVVPLYYFSLAWVNIGNRIIKVINIKGIQHTIKTVYDKVYKCFIIIVLLILK